MFIYLKHNLDLNRFAHKEFWIINNNSQFMISLLRIS